MKPEQLQARDFAGYPPEARRLAGANLETMRRLPLAFLPLLLRELIEYDWKFPVERREMLRQFDYLGKLDAKALGAEMQGFERLKLTDELEKLDWAGDPSAFSERLTAHLWASQQIDAFRTAAVDYVHRMNQAEPPAPAPKARLTLVALGSGVTQNRYPLFRKLRPHGVYYRNVKTGDGASVLLRTLASRAKADPAPFGHWYVDGGREGAGADGVTTLSYDGLAGVRTRLLDRMERAIRAGSGSEALRTILARMTPEQLGLRGEGDAAVLNRFGLSILTQGSGTQMFSTTFVQWTAREVLRRAQPVTLLARFTPRQREQTLKETLARRQESSVVLDPEGSLIDADMGAYYTWINAQRLPGSERSAFLVWFEGHSEALAAAPGLAGGSESGEAVELERLVERLAQGA